MSGIIHFLNQLHFRYITPQDVSLSMHLSSEMHNLELPPAYAPFYATLLPLQEIPRMSSFGVAAIIGYCLQQLPAGQCYLNIGVWYGFSFFSGLLLAPAAHCIGVDNFSEFSNENPREAFLNKLQAFKSGPQQAFYDMDYRDYFRQQTPPPIGLYFYDGAHDYQSQYEALTLARPFLAPDAIILVDDTNFDEPRQATLDFVKAHPDTVIVADLSTANNYHPTFWNGLMILRYCPAGR